MSTKDKSKKAEPVDISYGYAAHVNGLEEENLILRQTINHLNTELERFRKVPLIVCEVRDVIGKNALIRLSNGNSFYVEISEGCEKIYSGDSALAEQKNLTIIKKIPGSKEFDVEKFVIIEKPKTEWEDIGGLSEQIQEIQEVVELPMKNPELFRKIGIDPPKGILLHGLPGTGKTLLAKAVAHSTDATFIEIVASELVQKFIGEGAKLVREVFELAREKAPSIIFIDELDALASKRIDIGTSGEREVQRTFMQLLAEIDGFQSLGNVKVIGCTNRKDILDPAILRPGRLDRLIQVPIPNKDGRKTIFKIHTRKMTLDNVNPEHIIMQMEGFSGAEIKASCTEAGYYAIREGRSIVTEADILKGIEKVKKSDEAGGKEYLRMFG